MRVFVILVFLIGWQSQSWAKSPSIEQIFKANAGDKVGHYLGAPEAICVLSVFLPGQYVKNDPNYWIENDWQTAAEFASYPDATISGGYGWTMTPSSIRFYVNSSKKSFREFLFDPTTLIFVSFASVANGAKGNTCLLK